MQLDVEFIWLGGVSALERAMRVIARRTVVCEGLCAGGRRGLIRLNGGRGAQGLGGLGECLLHRGLRSGVRRGYDKIRLDRT